MSYDILPPEPGTTSIPPGHVRLYHQTTEDRLRSIEQHGLLHSYAKGIEGPKAIYACETGFYGEPGDIPTLEFHIPRENWLAPCFVLQDVHAVNIIVAHYPWHSHARYILDDPEVLQATLRGENDDLGKADRDYGPAVAYVKRLYCCRRNGSRRT